MGSKKKSSVYERVEASKPVKKVKITSLKSAGISERSTVSGGCDTLLLENINAAKKDKKGRVEAAVSNKSKLNVLVTILAVLFSQFLICVSVAVLIILHHNRMVDWFPALIEVTGKGYQAKREDVDVD